MKTKAIEKNWAELKDKIKSKWGKFSDEEVESVKGDLSQLAGKIRYVYGIAKEHADHQYDEFKMSVQSLIGPQANAETAKPSLTIAASTVLPKPNVIIAAQATQAAEPATMSKSKVVS